MSTPASSATIRTADGRHTLTTLIGQVPPAMSGGRGGWTEVPRPRRPAVLEWVGADAVKATLTLMLDAWASSGSLVASFATIDALAPIDPTGEPPTVYVTGAWPIPSTIPFQIQSALYGEPLRRANGAVARVEVTFELVEQRKPDVVIRSDPAKASVARNGTASRARPRTYVVRRGDTLSSIAAKQLGSASKWTQIRDANKGLRDPNHLTIGQKLALP